MKWYNFIFWPITQIIQILKTKSAKVLNLITFIMMLTGTSLMEIYAVNLVLNGARGAFLITNTISLIAAAVMLFIVLKYGIKNENLE